MNYWWVSQNKTFKQEIGGGYMWSPKADVNGKVVRSYSNMTKVAMGDLVLAFYQGAVQSIGLVTHHATSSPKPKDFGASGEAWSNSGWLVPVSWNSLPTKIRPRDHMLSLLPLLPERHSPIRSDGTGNQAYLFSIEKPLAEKIISMSGVRLDEMDGYSTIDFYKPEVLERRASAIEQGVINDTSISDTVKEAIVKSRRGQGKFKSNLFAIESQCRLTGVSDKRFLIASHIKAWSECDTNAERLDGYNGLLMSPNADRLFDKGFISFTDDGDVLISSRIDGGLLVKLGIKELVNVGQFYDKQKQYLEFHREVTFKK